MALSLGASGGDFGEARRVERHTPPSLPRASAGAARTDGDAPFPDVRGPLGCASRTDGDGAVPSPLEGRRAAQPDAARDTPGRARPDSSSLPAPKRRSLRALPTTVTELQAIARAARAGGTTSSIAIGTSTRL